MTSARLSNLRSILFAPGSDERKLTRALESDADAVVADLEDSVAVDEKPAARGLVARLLGAPGTTCVRIVRINGTDTEFWEDDAAALAELPLDAIVLPKATPESVDALGSSGPPLIAIVETALGLRLAFETAARPRVAALALGAADLGAELRLEPRADGLEILFARSSLVVDSAAAGVRAPFDVVHLDTRDDEGLEAESLLARSVGMGGKFCIHPAQVERREPGIRAGRGAARMGPTRRRSLRGGREGRPGRDRPGRRDDRPARGGTGSETAREGDRMTQHTETEAAPKVWRGRFYEDFDVGDALPEPSRPDDHRDGQHLVHAAHAEHEPDALQHARTRRARASHSRSSTRRSPSRSLPA